MSQRVELVATVSFTMRNESTRLATKLGVRSGMTLLMVVSIATLGNQMVKRKGTLTKKLLPT
jgi:hypothetical protein